MSLDRLSIGNVAERIKLFNSLMRGECNDDKRVKELLVKMRQLDEKQDGGLNAVEVENVKGNLQVLFNLHKANPNHIDVPQLLHIPKSHNLTKLSLDVVLSRYIEKAKDVLSSEDEYSLDYNSFIENCSSYSFLHTLKHLLLPLNSKLFSMATTEQMQPVSLPNCEFVCDVVPQMSSSSTTSSVSLPSPASAVSVVSGTITSDGCDDNSNISFSLCLGPTKICEKQERLSRSLSCIKKGERKVDDAIFGNSEGVVDETFRKKRRLNIEFDTNALPAKKRLNFNSRSLNTPDLQQLLSSFFEFQTLHLYSELTEKLWITETWAIITNSRHAHLFSKPVRIKGYLQAVKRPVDLSSTKKKLEKKEIVTIAQLHLELLRMFANAVMFNSSRSFCNQAAKEMALQLKQVIRSEKWSTFTGRR